MALNPTNGHIIAGVRIDDHRFLGRMKAAQLFQIAPDPRDTENKKKIDSSKELQEIRSIREEVQRVFENAKKKNVPSYANYIVEVYKGEDGITPAITLFTQAALDVDERDDGTCFLQVPWEERLVAIDGETQLAARHEASNIEPKTRQEFIPVYICYGRDLQWARQSFHDLNTLGVKPNTALSIGMDARDPVTKICRDVERYVHFFNGKVNKQRRQLKTTDQDVVTITTLRGACVTIAKGINGVQYGSRPVDVDDTSLNSVRSAAVDWFDAVAEAIGPAMEDREHKLASTSAVMAAIGAIGHQLVGIGDDEVRRERARTLADDLRSVNWERGKRWEGIAGKYTPKGVFSVGGAKENAYAVYSALTDRSTDGYKRVRPSLATAA